MCVIVRDLIVFGVLTDMMRGRPAVYATFSSYDEVAHHSGLERADTLEALRKLDQQFGRIERARRYAPRPYEIVVLSDHGQTQGATFKQRNGYGLDELVERSLSSGEVAEFAGGDEQSAMVGHAINEATGRDATRRSRRTTSPIARWSCSGSGNLGLIYLMEERAPADDGGDRRASPRAAAGAALAPPRRLAAGPVVRARAAGARRIGRAPARRRGGRGRRSAGELLAHRGPAPAAHRRLRARRRRHGRQLLRPRARRGLRVRGADLLPRRARRARRRGRSSSIPSASRCRPSRCSGAAGVHAVLSGWRAELNGAKNQRPQQRPGSASSLRLSASHDPRSPPPPLAPRARRGFARRRVHRDRPGRAERDLHRAAVAARRRADVVAAGRRGADARRRDLAGGADLGDRGPADRRRGGRGRGVAACRLAAAPPHPAPDRERCWCCSA